VGCGLPRSTDAFAEGGDTEGINLIDLTHIFALHIDCPCRIYFFAMYIDLRSEQCLTVRMVQALRDPPLNERASCLECKLK
jgi:hypothetical protein